MDATIINAPTSTKNREKERDPEMHQTKKGNQWYFGMKAHIGMDSRTRLIHSVAATPANVHDSQMLPDLLHGNETRVWGDSAYSGQGDVIHEHAPNARDFTQRKASRNRPLTQRMDCRLAEGVAGDEKKDFTLKDAYALEPSLRVLHPDNRHIQAKIGQQLQMLRDRGILRFLGNGRYSFIC